MPSLQDLTTPRSREDLEQLLLSALQSQGFPVGDYLPGTPGRSIVRMAVAALADREDLPRSIAAGGFLDLAAELKNANGNPLDAVAEALAESQYQVARIPASYSRVFLTLSCTQGPGPYQRGPGEMESVSVAGNRYVNTGAIVIPDGGETTAEFQAIEPGFVLDPIGAIDQLSTPLPGVDVQDKLAQFSEIASSWSGSGNIIPSSANAIPSPARTIRILVTRTGRIGSGAQITLEIYPENGTVERTTQILVQPTYAVGDISLAFQDGPANSVPSYIQGDSWLISAPGSPTISTGAPAESLESLASRCRLRWPGMSKIPTESRVTSWVMEASAQGAMGINRIKVQPSTTTAGTVDAFVADRRGKISPQNLTRLQRYLDVRASGPNERAIACMCSGVAVAVSGKVWTRRGRTAEIQAKAKTAFAEYLANVPVGGEMPGHLVRVSKLDQILENCGVFNSEFLAFQGAEPDIDLKIPAGSVPVLGAGLDTLEWLEVS